MTMRLRPIRMENNLWETLKVHAKYKNNSASELIRQLIITELKKENYGGLE